MGFPLPVASSSFTSISIGIGVPGNGRIAVEMLSLSCIAAEILLRLPPLPPLATYVRKIGLATRMLQARSYIMIRVNIILKIVLNPIGIVCLII